MFRIARDANHREPAIAVHEPNALAERRRVRPFTLRERLVHHHDRGRVGIIVLVDVAPGHEREADRPEVVGTDGIELQDGRTPFFRLRGPANGVPSRVGVATQWDRPNECSAPHARHRADLHDGSREEVGDLLRLRVLRGGKPELHREQVRRVEAEVDLLKLHERPGQQAGADEEHDRERQLGDDEHTAQLDASNASREPAGTRRERVIEIRARRVKRRGEAERDPRRDGHERRECHYPLIDADRAEEREVDRNDRDQQSDAAVRHGHAEQPAERREDDALGEQLAGETSPARA